MELIKRAVKTKETYLIFSLILIIVGFIILNYASSVKTDSVIEKIDTVEYKRNNYLEVEQLKSYISTESYIKLSSGDEYAGIYEYKYYSIKPTQILSSQYIIADELEPIINNEFSTYNEQNNWNLFGTSSKCILVFSEHNYIKYKLYEVIGQYFIVIGFIILCALLWIFSE